MKKNAPAILVIHEIYGVNNHMKTICESLTKHGFHVYCPNLLEREPFDYSKEDSAYQYFIEEIGFINASDKVKQLLKDIRRTHDKVFIVGFSVGATIAWLCSEENSVDGIVGYYGSRIRNYVEINPICPILLFFPEKEQSFEVDALIAALTKNQTKVYKLQGQHGFSDPYSQKYIKESAQTSYNEMLNFFIHLS